MEFRSPSDRKKHQGAAEGGPAEGAAGDRWRARLRRSPVSFPNNLDLGHSNGQIPATPVKKDKLDNEPADRWVHVEEKLRF